MEANAGCRTPAAHRGGVIASPQLLADCARGDREAFQEFFLLYQDRVYSTALHYTADPAAAMDIAQDVFVKLFSAIAGFRGQSSFDTWLYRLVANCCHDRHRRTRRLTPFDGDTPAAALTEPAADGRQQAEERQRARHVRACVAQLPDELRIAVVLRYSQGLGYEEIAAVLGCPAGTVASRLNRAHRELAARLAHWNNKKGADSR